jgi:hypothetical protein
MAILIASLGALAPVILGLVILPVVNALLVRPRLGTGLWNSAPGWQGLVALLFEWILFGLIFWTVGKTVNKYASMSKKTLNY